MKSLLAAGLVLALLTLSAAAGRAQEKLPASTPYYPLAVGSVWEYRAGESKFVIRLAKIEKVGTTPCARLELTLKDRVVSFEDVGVVNEALCRFTFEGKKAEPPIPFLKLQAKKGDSWKVESKVADQTLKGTFKVGEEEVKVPAGTFKTLTVTGDDLEVNGVKMSLTYYFAEKVGMVKQVMELAGKKVVIELESHKPGKE